MSIPPLTIINGCLLLYRGRCRMSTANNHVSHWLLEILKLLHNHFATTNNGCMIFTFASTRQHGAFSKSPMFLLYGLVVDGLPKSTSILTDTRKLRSSVLPFFMALHFPIIIHPEC